MRLSTLLPLLGLFALGYAKGCPRQRTSPGKEILCYTSSNDADQLVDTICRCTTLVHQGHELHNLSTAGIEELQKTLKEANPVLQVVVSVTDPQGTLKTSATTRQEASGRLANLLSQVDGVELDITAGSKERLSHFVKGLKDEMIRKSNEKRIIMALPTKAEELAKQYDLKALAKYVDLFTLSTHYLVDDSESFNTFHPSRLMGIFDMLNADSLVDLVSGLGAPKKKLLVSVPASAYKFTLKNEGKTTPGSLSEEKEPTAISQKELCDMMSAGEWTVERDTDLTAPYAFKDSTWIAYEDKTSVGIKGKYVLLRELAGLGVHDIENDAKNDCGKPVTFEVHRSFTEMKRKTRGAVLASLENDLHYVEAPHSKNVKSSGYRIVRVVDTAGAIHAIRENTQTEFVCTRQGYFTHPKSCNRFYRCVKFNQEIDDFSVFEFDCPAGLAFDERTEVCVWPGSLPEGSPCPGSSEIAPVPRNRFRCPERDGFYADPQNCRWFFGCFDMGQPEPTAYEFRCPFGLVFDEKKLICDWPWLVSGCGESGYARKEYGGSGGYAGSNQGHLGGGAHAGGYYDGANGGAGPYGSGADGSLYPGSRPSESRYSETGPGQYGGKIQTVGAGASGLGHGGHATEAGNGFGSGGSSLFGHGTHGSGSGYSGAGAAGSDGSTSGYFGSGADGSSRYSGEHSASGADQSIKGGYHAAGDSGAGATHSGIGSAGVTYGNGGATGSAYSGAGASSGAHSGTGSAGVTYVNGGATGSGYSGAGATHSSDSGAGSAGVTSGNGAGYSGAGASGSHSGQSGIGSQSAGVTYVNSGDSGEVDYSQDGDFGSKYSGSSSGSGSTQSGYHGQTSSTGNLYNGNTGVVVETLPFGQGQDSSSYVSGTTGSGYAGHTGAANTGYTVNVAGNAAGHDNQGEISSSVTNYGSSGSMGQDFGKGGVTISHQTGEGDHGISSGVTGTAYIANSGHNAGNHYTNAVNTGYTTSGEHVSDGQDLYNGGLYTGSVIATGSTGSGYSSTDASGSAHNIGGSTGYSAASGGRVSDEHDVVNGGFNSPTVTLTGTTLTGATGYYSGNGNTLTSGNPAFHSIEVKQPGIVIQTVTPGYSVTGSGASHGGIYGGSSTGYEQTSGGAFETSSGYNAAHTGSGNSVIDEAQTDYHGGNDNGGYVSGITGTTPGVNIVNNGVYNKGGNAYVENSSSSSVSNIGKDGISTGTTTYHGNSGTSNTYLASKTSDSNAGGIHNTVVTSNADSGTISTLGDNLGVVVTENASQGSVFGSTSGPGYVQSHSTVTPGYVIDGVTRSTYGHSAPATFLTGTAAPGVILHGTTGSGSFVGEQGYEGVSIGGSTGNVYSGNSAGVTGGTTTYFGSTGSSGNTAGNYHGEVEAEFAGNSGSDFGSKTTSYVKADSSSSDQDMGYKTNEYHDNGGRGTIVYNNGHSTSKFTESDLQKSTPTFATLSDSIVSGGRPDGSKGVVLGNTLAGVDSYTSQGFTKTGPTRTGITTAAIGGTGSYVIQTGYTGAVSNQDANNIGSNAFKGQSTHSSIGSDVNGLAYVTSTGAPDESYIDTSKINLGYKSTGESSGYSYEKPTVPFITGSAPASTPAPVSVTYQETIVPLTHTTPSSYSSFKVYNTPTVVTSAPITAAPAVVNTFTADRKPLYQTAEVPTIGTVSRGYNKYRRPSFTGDVQRTTVYRRPITGQKQYTVAPTLEPIAFVKKPAEVYKTTLFEAAKTPIVVSTVAPVFDNGYKTVISSTPTPIAVTTGQYYYKDNAKFYTSPATTGETFDNLDITVQQPDFTFQKQYVSSTVAPNDGYSYEKPANPLTYNSPSTVTPSVTIYQRPTVTVQHQGTYNEGSTSVDDSDDSYHRPSVSIRPAGFNKTPVRKGYPAVVSTSTSDEGSKGGYDYSAPSVKFVTPTTTPVYTESEGNSYSNGGSPTKLNIPQGEVTKLVHNYNNRGHMKFTAPTVYVDDNADSGYKSFGHKATVPSKTYVSSTLSPVYEATTLDSSIRSNPYSGKDYHRTGGYPSSPLYEVSTVKSVAAGHGKGRVIVKLSDLHPLLLGKLGAQCTCRSDPFANLRGPGAKNALVDSSVGKINLGNFKESDVYVDLEVDRESDKSSPAYKTPNGLPTKLSPSGYSSSLRTPVTAVFGLTTPSPPVLRYRGKPSTAYLPVSSTPLTLDSSSANKVVPLEDGAYGSPSDNSDAQFVDAPSDFGRGDIPVGRSAAIKSKTGKSLGGVSAGANALGGAGAAFDRYGPGGWRSVDETLQGGSDCARAGLFRHPKYCNKFYACHWDDWKQKFTLHVFNCPVHLSFDIGAGACNWPSKGPACQDDNLLV